MDRFMRRLIRLLGLVPDPVITVTITTGKDGGRYYGFSVDGDPDVFVHVTEKREDPQW